MQFCTLGLSPADVASAWVDGIRSVQSFELLADGTPLEWVAAYETGQ